MSEHEELPIVILVDMDGTLTENVPDIIPSLLRIKEKNPAQKIILATSSPYTNGLFSDGTQSDGYCITPVRTKILREKILEKKGFLRDLYKEVDYTEDEGFHFEDIYYERFPEGIRGENDYAPISEFLPREELIPTKTDPEFCQVVAKNLGVLPEQLLLIDDSSKNTVPFYDGGGWAISPNEIDKLEEIIAQRSAIVNAKNNIAEVTSHEEKPVAVKVNRISAPN